MPAVDPTRLRFQIDKLMEFFQSPEEFHHHLQDLFGFYANRTLRFGDSTTRRPLIPAYNLPSPVIRQLELDLTPHITAEPEVALALADELWEDEFFEVKSIAVLILGSVPVENSKPITTRMLLWLSPDLDQTLTARLFSTGAMRLQETFPKEWESLIEAFLNHQDPDWTTLGIIGLSEGLTNPGFSNLPAVFRLISPFIQTPKRPMFRHLEQLIKNLACQSPTETAFFLKQVLAIRESKQTAQLIKQCLHHFPETIRQEVEASLKK